MSPVATEIPQRGFVISYSGSFSAFLESVPKRLVRANVCTVHPQHGGAGDVWLMESVLSRDHLFILISKQNPSKLAEAPPQVL